VYEGDGAAPLLAQRLLSRLPVSDIVLEKSDIDSMVANIYRRSSSTTEAKVA